MHNVRLAVALVFLSMNLGSLGENPRIGERVLLVVGSTLALLGAALFFSRRTCRQLRSSSRPPFQTLTRFRRIARFYHPLSLALFIAQTIFFGWGVVARHLLDGWFLIDDLLFLSPLIVTEIAGTILSHAVDVAVDERTQPHGFSNARENSRSSLLLRIREEHGLWLGIVLIVLVTRDMLDALAPRWGEQPFAAILLIVMITIVSLALIPLLLRVVWSFQPIPEGTLRTHLLEVAHRENIRLADVLVWKTRFPIANAGVAGLIPRLRYVFLSETLLENLTPLEIVGVFGHEIGHVRHRHLLYFLTLIPLSLVALILLGDWLDISAPQPWSRLLALVPSFFWLAIPFYAIVILALSRRFEKQADLAGCRGISQEISRETISAEGVRVFMHTLEKVCLINGTDVDQWMWRHGRVNDRLRFLEKVAAQPALARRFDFLTMLLCRSLLAALAGIVLLFLPRLFP